MNGDTGYFPSYSNRHRLVYIALDHVDGQAIECVPMVSKKFLRNDDHNQALAPERIIGVETGGCPHTAIREDASINLEAVARLKPL